jgi:hypothetical protein
MIFDFSKKFYVVISLNSPFEVKVSQRKEVIFRKKKA